MARACGDCGGSPGGWARLSRKEGLAPGPLPLGEGVGVGCYYLNPALAALLLNK